MICCFFLPINYHSQQNKMVKNLRGGKLAKRQCAKVKSKTTYFPSDAEFYENPDKFVVGKIIEQHNQKHYRVLTMDSNRLSVFASTDNNVGRLQKDSYVLMYSPNVEYHFKIKSSRGQDSSESYEKHKSIIISKLDLDTINVLTNKFGIAFISQDNPNSYINDIDFRDEDPESESESQNDYIDINNI